METYRLKNIAIVILALLNGFLLLLLGYQYYQSQMAAAETERQLRTLFAGSHLALAEDVDLRQGVLRPLGVRRHSEEEAAMAAFLLDGEVQSTNQGGGIYSYENGCGTMQFRSVGLLGVELVRPVSDVEEFARDFCDQFGYRELRLELKGQSGTAAAVQYVDGVPIRGCTVTMTFDRGVLTAISGTYVALEDGAIAAGERLSAVTALTRFLDYRGEEGIVCNRVEDLRCVYVLPSAASAQMLLPAWQVVTDTYTYFVDCATGEITRQ